jgi:hypothetical protein
VKNPQNIPARRFALKAGKKHLAIYCSSGRGPCFGCPWDIAVSDNCNANTSTYVSLGNSYTNDTGLDGHVVFTVSAYLQVEEIEIFEITA